MAEIVIIIIIIAIPCDEFATLFIGQEVYGKQIHVFLGHFAVKIKELQFQPGRSNNSNYLERTDIYRLICDVYILYVPDILKSIF